MFRIGEFSRLGRVTIETLRHYDAVGLLNPAKVDPSTGYRYYSAKQLKLLSQILALKEVGFSLEEIARILRENLSAEELRGMLKAQLVLAESSIESATLRRERILTRLDFLNLEENMPAYEVTLKSLEPITVAAIRQTVPSVNQMGPRIGEMFHQIANWMMSNRLTPGLPLTIYHNNSYTQEHIDTECVIPIYNTESSKIPQPTSPIVVRQTSAFAHAATTIVANNKPESFQLAYNTIGQWIEDHGYCIVGAPRELYFTPPGQEDFTAEIQFPVERGER